MKARRRSVLPGFGPTLGLTLVYLSLVVLIPLAGVLLKTSSMTWAKFWTTVTDARALAAYRLTLTASLTAAGINGVFGFVAAWVLVRYRFPGRRLVDAMVDLPFAMPTAVAGIALTALYSANGWIGRYLEPAGFKVAFTATGIVVALTFIGLPFVIRTLQPVLEELPREIEEAAASLGASRSQSFARILVPYVCPAWITGMTLAFARGLGEYGSVVFISGNIPMRTEIAPLLIMTKLEQYDYAGATAIALVMLVVSFCLLLAINQMQAWTNRHALGE